MDTPFILRTMASRKLLNPGSPARIVRQLNALRRWGFGLYGEMRSTAARDPDRVAVIDEDRQVTYAELDVRVRRLANALRAEHGIRAGDRVGLLCNNSAGMVEAMLALIALGAQAVLVNTGLGNAQLEAVAHDQSLTLLVHDDDLLGMLAAVPPNLPRLAMSKTGGLIHRAPSAELEPPGDAGSVVVLTSGTTGAPKGARRRNPSSLGPLASVVSRIPLYAGERMFVAAPLFHTWGLAALQLCLALRGTIVVARRFTAQSTVDAVRATGCTSLFAVPVMLQRLLEAPAPMPTLRVAATSGSALTGPLASRFMDVYGPVLYNLYGSTEASWVSIATPEELRSAPGTAGRPPHGTRVAILSDTGTELPTGVIGRIFVGNDMLFEGYTNGTGRESHGDLLGTGDLGHLSADGLLFVDGREDDMVISGGENVYPAAVEDVIAELPQVREVAVAGVPDEEFGQRLAAWIALHDGEYVDPEAVREYVRHRLARFSVPRDVHYIAALPRNATGKVVRRQLYTD
ncbi:AMP-binding protein [Dactylosporangium aurantiacum]|uniref:AMP-binding protein n=1 Tax=Dactylosporangium aurantiacum TaxID=35754 RepID=A0A9Q9IKS4_9ACTN|nr:AMP-binding protein [Dactylosporangium aurantiacum]MDG6110159.1 AMP-binding protein [Dactylosporangium aurantiacum]UWZ54645.1 AMP-binding protein [Dactylosporangium aurantiacum]